MTLKNHLLKKRYGESVPVKIQQVCAKQLNIAIFEDASLLNTLQTALDKSYQSAMNLA